MAISDETESILLSIYDLPPEDIFFLSETLSKVSEMLKNRNDDGSKVLQRQRIEKLKSILEDQNRSFSGPEACVIAATIISAKKPDGHFISREITDLLKKYHRSVANITATIRNLSKRGFLEQPTQKKNAHKSTTVTKKGSSWAFSLIQ